jgi:outer membrane protein TolC
VAERNLTIAEDALKAQRSHLEDARVARQAGTVADFDVLRSEAAVSQAERDLLSAQNLRSQSRANLLTLLGERVTTSVALAALELPGEPPRDVEKELDEALARRPDLVAVERAVAAAEAQVGLAEVQDAPTLVLQSGVTPRNQIGINPAFQWLTSLVLNIPLFDGGSAAAQAEVARQAVLSLRAQLENARRQVRLDIFNTWLDLKTRFDTLAVARKNVAQAAEAFRIASLRYRFGLGTNVELLDSRTALTTAQTAEARAYYDYISSWGHYQRIIGLSWPRGKTGGPSSPVSDGEPLKIAETFISR